MVPLSKVLTTNDQWQWYQFPRCWQQVFSDNGTNFQGADNRCSVTMVPVPKVLTTGVQWQWHQFPRCWQQVFSDNGTSFQGADNPLLDPGMLLKTKEQSEWVQVHPSNYLWVEIHSTFWWLMWGHYQINENLCLYFRWPDCDKKNNSLC